VNSRVGPPSRWNRVVTSGVSRILGGSAVGQGALLAVSPILTRLYTPTDFATLTVFTAICALVGAVVTLNWDRAIVIPRSDSQAASLVILGTATVLLLSGVFAVASYFLGPMLDDWFHTRIFETFWWIMPLTTLLMGFYSMFSSWLVRGRHYGKIATRNASMGVAQAASMALLGLSGAGAVGLLSGPAVGRAVALTGALRSLRNRTTPRQSLRRVRVVATRYWKFPIISTWSRLLNVLGIQLAPILIVALYGTVEAGLFALTVRVLAAPVGVVTDAVSQQFEGRFAEKLRMRSPGLASQIPFVSVRLFLLALLPGALIVLYGPALFSLIFGEEWRVAGVYAQVVVVSYVLQFSVSPISRALLVLERQFTQLRWDISRTCLTTLAVLIPILIDGGLILALAVLAGVQSLLYIILFVTCVRSARSVERGYYQSR
jgi:O-antigen/teichoic acid export membrane protein